MASRVRVNAHIEFEISRFGLNRHIKVSAFKITVKDEWLRAESHLF